MQINNRNIYLFGPINSTNVSEAISAILELTMEDDTMESQLTSYERDPIQIFINTPGGDVYHAFGLCDVIMHSTTPIHGIAIGKCMSAGMPIFAACHHRISYPNTTFMWHMLSTSLEDQSLHNIIATSEECQRIQSVANSIMTSRSLIDNDMIASCIAHDWYIDAATAHKLQLIDEMVEGHTHTKAQEEE